jgi:hypothetical protein
MILVVETSIFLKAVKFLKLDCFGGYSIVEIAMLLFTTEDLLPVTTLIYRL